MGATQSEVDALVARLRPHGKDIRADMDAGDADARDVIGYYTMVARLPEPGAMVACEAALDRWLKKRGRA